MHGGLLCIAFRLSVVTGPKFRMASISGTVILRVMKFGHNMDVDDPKVELEDQGHRSKVKVTRSKNGNFMAHLTILQVIFEVKGRMGQSQRSHGSRS